MINEKIAKLAVLTLTLVAHGRVQQIHAGRGEADAVDAVGHGGGLGAGQAARVAGHRHGRTSHPGARGRVGTHAPHPVVWVAVVGRQRDDGA